MKSKLLFSFALLLMAFSVKATTVTVNAEGMVFTPANVTINLGDTVKFVYVSGSDHTTTSVTIPAGAATWDAPLTQAAPTFIYVPTVAGNYSYVCTPHAPGMAGTFKVNPAAGISDLAAVNEVFSMYPNPAQSTLNISLKNKQKDTRVTVADLAGKQVLALENITSGNTQLDISHLSNGLYFIRVVENGRIYVRKFAVNH